MTRARQNYDDRGSEPERSGIQTLESETLRSSSQPPSVDVSRGDEKISVFWRVFGGTLLSIGALVIITVYNQFSGSLTDLRKDVNQLHEVRGDLVRKEEFSGRLTSLWSGIKELQQSNQSMAALNERSKLLDMQVERQIKSGDEDRRDLHRRLEEQRRAAEEDRREFQRKLEEQRKAFEEERKELTRLVQALSERLVKVENRANKTAAVKKD